MFSWSQRGMLVACWLFFSQSPYADTLVFKTETTVECKVNEFKDGVFYCVLKDGSQKMAHAKTVRHITFQHIEGAAPELAPPFQDVSKNNQQLIIKCIEVDDSVKLEAELKRDFRNDGHKAIAFKITVSNSSPNAIEIDWHRFKVRSKDNMVLEASAFALGAHPFTPDGVVDPGDKYGGWIAIEAPLNVIPSECSIRYEKDDYRSDWFPAK